MVIFIIVKLEFEGDFSTGNIPVIQQEMIGEDVEEQKKKVRLYSLSTCPTCKRVKKILDEHNIKYELIEVDLLDSGEQWVTSKEIKRYNPAVTYPTLVVEEVIVEFDEEAIKETLGIK